MPPGGLWGWVQDVGRTCGFAQQPQSPAMWVRANPDLFPQEVPGMSDELLQQVNKRNGSLEEKLQHVIDAFRSNARHLESLQQVLRRRALDRREQAGEKHFPAEVEEVISDGTYVDSFLEAYDGQKFLLYSEEVVPCHGYNLALEVHSGGSYWSGVATQDSNATKQKVQTVTASSSTEGSMNLVSQFGAAQRGAVFVWRWEHLRDQGPYNIPDWLTRALVAEGNDPLRKLMAELEGLRRWEQQVKQETAKYVKLGSEVKDPFIKEVLRLWPTESDHQGGEQLKKCAWVEGLDSRLFVAKPVVICKVPFDGSHTLILQAVVSKRHAEDTATDGNPPYRLATTWSWFTPPQTVTPAGGITDGNLGSQDRLLHSANSLSSLASQRTDPQLVGSRPGTSQTTLGGDVTRPGTSNSDMTRPGSMNYLRGPSSVDTRSETASGAPTAPSAVTHTYHQHQPINPPNNSNTANAAAATHAYQPTNATHSIGYAV
eukprot:CAMPEP_0206529258 /NCGR_PEP_ID=MMETSP0325_2-20121206/2491_1 /ASSEMBLY_ACC=CAM_ASM_000347 /TAXON_ID=2866 /ORGANISM="Crypthecodinium cohnii, Strain Seligo" /LENGTH=485 /DNA_ID=CAMNT_0054025133 /DNA_START=128 /DNA_END=1582 /DNA_ORIENTATION=-